jgi:hypothetical protein
VITLTLWQMRWRLLILLPLALFFYVQEPGFHLAGVSTADLAPDIVDPGGIAFTLANLAGASMLVLLAGFVSTDRREGYYRIYFSHTTRPLAFYAVRWGVAYAVSLGVATLFLVLGQLAAWGDLRVGPGALVQPALFALVYGGLVAFFSVVLRRGDSLAAFGVYFLTSAWEYALSVFAELGTQPVSPLLREILSFVLPPHLALRDYYEAARLGTASWEPLAFAAGYGVFWLVIAGLLLWSREWP